MEALVEALVTCVGEVVAALLSAVWDVLDAHPAGRLVLVGGLCLVAAVLGALSGGSEALAWWLAPLVLAVVGFFVGHGLRPVDLLLRALRALAPVASFVFFRWFPLV